MSNFVLEVYPNISYWQQLQQQIEQLSKLQHWSDKQLFDVTLICEEWLINIINHGKCDPNETILIEVADLPTNMIKIHFSDPGIPFTPFTEPIPDERSAHIEQNYGGLGLFFIQSKISDHQYHYRNNRNQLTMYYTKNMSIGGH